MSRFGNTFALLLWLCASTANLAARSVTLLDSGWEIYRLPGFQLWPAQPRLTPGQVERLKCPPPGQGWEAVQIPDDYVVRGEFSPEPNASLLAGGAVCPVGGRECGPPGAERVSVKTGGPNRPRNQFGGHGYLPVYPAWYRRSIAIPAADQGQTIWLDFEGVYRDAAVFVNGRFIDEDPSVYTGFRLNITSAVRFGAANIITVFVDPRWFEGWWYEGGGIYRHVRLIVADPLQVAPWGTFVQTQGAQLTIQTTVRNDHLEKRAFTLVSEVIDPSGKQVASVANPEELASGQEATFSQHVSLRYPALWSLEHPNLYRLATSIRVGDAAIDEEQTSFGIRTLRFDPNEGFFLNGRRVEIQGVCAHQDFPGVGIAAPDNLWPWRIAKLKAMGANAYRCAHGPVSEAFYDAADRMGLLVMDENRHLGDSYLPAGQLDAPYSDLSDVKAMVLRHRNHPSIIMWSLCNEGGCKGSTQYGAKAFAATREAVKSLDPMRPTTGAMNGGFTKEGVASVEDIPGMNYHNEEFAKNHSQFPKLMIFGSEDFNAKTARVALETNPETGLCAQYADDCEGGPWRSWVPTRANPFVAGQFIWTAFDYRGEPNPFSWPAVTSQTGAMDLCGFPKPVYYYWKIAWDSKPAVYIFPERPARRVRAFSNCDRVELLLDGKSLGVRSIPRNEYLDWEVADAGGELTAIGYNQGREAARYSLHPAGAATALRLIPEVDELRADGEALAPVRVEVVDSKGHIVPDADTPIEFSVSGDGTLAGVGNGNPASHEPNLANRRRTFGGLAMILVRSTDRPGAITIRAQAPGLTPAEIAIRTRR